MEVKELDARAQAIYGEMIDFQNNANDYDQMHSLIRGGVLEDAWKDRVFSECAEDFEDLKHFEATKELRRPDVWANELLG